MVPQTTSQHRLHRESRPSFSVSRPISCQLGYPSTRSYNSNAAGYPKLVSLLSHYSNTCQLCSPSTCSVLKLAVPFDPERSFFVHRLLTFYPVATLFSLPPNTRFTYEQPSPARRCLSGQRRRAAPT